MAVMIWLGKEGRKTDILAKDNSSGSLFHQVMVRDSGYLFQILGVRVQLGRSRLPEKDIVYYNFS